MTFLDKLKSHVNCLIRLKTQLYWYNSDVCDGIEGRVCLLLDAAAIGGVAGLVLEARHINIEIVESVDESNYPLYPDAFALLFIDGSPKWVCLSEKIVEFIQ
jgi:hypothetical protein